MALLQKRHLALTRTGRRAFAKARLFVKKLPVQNLFRGKHVDVVAQKKRSESTVVMPFGR